MVFSVHDECNIFNHITFACHMVFDSQSSAVYFPCGNYMEEFVNEAVVFVFDSIGDYYLLIQNITVSKLWI